MSEQCTEASRATATYGRRGHVPPVLLFNTALTMLSVIFKIEEKKKKHNKVCYTSSAEFRINVSNNPYMLCVGLAVVPSSA